MAGMSTVDVLERGGDEFLIELIEQIELTEWIGLIDSSMENKLIRFSEVDVGSCID